MFFLLIFTTGIKAACKSSNFLSFPLTTTRSKPVGAVSDEDKIVRAEARRARRASQKLKLRKNQTDAAKSTSDATSKESNASTKKPKADPIVKVTAEKWASKSKTAKRRSRVSARRKIQKTQEAAGKEEGGKTATADDG
jgi:hypothetical protein